MTHEDETGHAATDHGATDHGHENHEAEPLGPVDVAAWGAGALGIVLGLVAALVLALSAGWIAIS